MISWVHWGIFSTSRGIMIHVGEQVDKSLWFILKTLMYLWYVPDVLMISLWSTHDIPPMYWTSPNELMISSDVLRVSRRCTKHPPMHWTHIIHGDIHKQHFFHSYVFHFYLFTYLRIFYTLAVLDLWSVSVIHIYKKHRFHSTVVHLYWLRYLQIWHILSVLVF